MLHEFRVFAVDIRNRLAFASAARQEMALSDDRPEFLEFARRLLVDSADAWVFDEDRIWVRAFAKGMPLRHQGWKIHVSATVDSACAVLARTIEVLRDDPATFKFARDLSIVALMTSARFPRVNAGKVITVYPTDDGQFERLVARIDAATNGMPGQTILSDQQYRPGGVVGFRYGAFRRLNVLTNDAMYVPAIVSPTGEFVEDKRLPYFRPPTWARLPPAIERHVQQHEQAADAKVFLAGRYVVRGAIRQANRGGVFVALDLESGDEVVIKQARPYVGGDGSGGDARSWLRHEAAMLARLDGLGVAPRLLDLFEHEGHVFLVEERIDGVNLAGWLSRRYAALEGEVPLPVLVSLVEDVIALLEAVHRTGIVICDVSPQNVMLASGLSNPRPRIVDLELAVEAGSRPVGRGTAGYAAPEQIAGDAVSHAADLFSLGGLVFFLLGCGDPAFLPDIPASRSSQARLAAVLDVAGRSRPSIQVLRPLLDGLLCPDPRRRWNARDAVAFLRARKPLRVATTVGPSPTVDIDPQVEEVVQDAVNELTSCATGDGDRPWRTTPFGIATHSCSVQHGAAGVAGVLNRASLAGLNDTTGVMERASVWMCRRLQRDPLHVPGLYYGAAGVAWALFDLSIALADSDLERTALDIAMSLPTRWPNPDVTHGVAGVGLLHAYLAERTGDLLFRRRLHDCAAGLLEEIESSPTEPLWRVAADFPSIFAGKAYYGFAHGAAGIGCFFLAAALLEEREDWLHTARSVGDLLCRASVVVDDRAGWTSGPDDVVVRPGFWCHGGVGIASFLIRLHCATRLSRYRRFAEMAARAAYDQRWSTSTATCHGLAGTGDLLVDLSVRLPDSPFRCWAREVAEILALKSAKSDGRWVVPDEQLGRGQDYGGGVAGVLAFLLRQRDDAPRMWLPEVVA